MVRHGNTGLGNMLMGGGWSPYTKQWAQEPIQKSMTSQVPYTKPMPP